MWTPAVDNPATAANRGTVAEPDDAGVAAAVPCVPSEVLKGRLQAPHSARPRTLVSARAFCIVSAMPRPTMPASCRGCGPSGPPVRAVAVAAFLAPASPSRRTNRSRSSSRCPTRSGRPVRDLKRDEIVVSENGVEAEIEKVEPFRDARRPDHRGGQRSAERRRARISRRVDGWCTRCPRTWR